MSIALRRPMDVLAFLAWEERQDLRHEFDGAEPVAMVGGTFAHSRIASNIERALAGRLPERCQPVRGDLQLRMAASIRYPDVMVICSPVALRASFVTDPVVIFEVLSDSTSYTDRLVKSREYREIASLARYVIVEQTGLGATVFDRPDWRGQPVAGAEVILALPELGIELPLSAFYTGIDFAAETA